MRNTAPRRPQNPRPIGIFRRLSALLAAAGLLTAALGGCPLRSELGQDFRDAAGDSFETGLRHLADGDQDAAGDAIADGIITGLFDWFEPETTAGN